IEVTRPNRQARRLHGKSDPLDAIAAARAVLAEQATATPKPRTVPVEAIRLIRTTRSSAVKARKQAIQQIHGLLYGAPDHLRTALTGLSRAALVTRCAKLRPHRTADLAADLADPTVAATHALRTLARRIQHLDTEISHANTHLATLITTIAP